MAGIAALYWFLQIPSFSGSENILGVSSTKMMLIALMGLAVVVSLGIVSFSELISMKMQSIINWLDHKAWGIINFLLSFTTLSAFLFILLPFYPKTWSISISAIQERLAPIIAWLGISTLIVLVIRAYSIQSFQPKNIQVNHNRLGFIDLARGMALFFSISSHMFSGANLWADLGLPGKIYLALTRFTTPEFIAISGMMLEIVYYRTVIKKGFGAAQKRLIVRSIQCYGFYAASVFFELFANKFRVEEGLRSLIFLGPSYYSEILKYYTFLLLLFIPLLWLRHKWGWKIAAIPGIAAWGLVPFITNLPWDQYPGEFHTLSAYWVGRPVNLSNFSILHSLIFVSIGLIIANLMKTPDGKFDTARYIRTALYLAGICAAISASLLIWYSPQQLFNGYTGYFRLHHHPGYYFISLTGGLLLMSIAPWFLRQPWLKPFILWFEALGKDSLYCFLVGNSLAALWPWQWIPGPALKLLNIFILLGVTALISILRRALKIKPNIAQVPTAE